MWIVARYLPVSFFSLKPASATSSGGKTLLVPTPFAIKMALLGIAIRNQGLDEGERLFPFIRDLALSLEPPEEILIMKSFSKIRRELKDKANAEKARRARERKDYPMQPTIAYREYVNYRGMFCLACQCAEPSPLAVLLPTFLAQINYLGKRGGFFQIMAYPQTSDSIPEGHFTQLTSSTQEFRMDGTLQMLDDCGPSLTFAKANLYDPAKITIHRDRIFHHIVLPYRQRRSSRSYSWYQRMEE